MASFIIRRTEENFANRKRKDGLQWPWHHFQIVGWALYIFFGITAFGFILPLLPCAWQSTSYGILGILYFGHFVFHVLTISVDTSNVDPNVPVNIIESKNTKPKKMHCHIIPVTFYKEKTRFCHVCRKNVFNFDHHSQIFNTCIGGRNFWFYMNCIVTAFLGATYLAITSLFVFSIFCHPPWGKIDLSDSWIFPKTTPEIQAVVILLISFIDGILSLLLASVLGYHICFHLYLLRQGLTTQEYCEYLALKNSFHQSHMRSRDLEAAQPHQDFHQHTMLSVSKKSRLYLCDTAMQTEQTLMKNANVTTQTHEGRFLHEAGSQTETKKGARQPSTSLTNVVQMLRTPFKLSRKTSAI